MLPVRRLAVLLVLALLGAGPLVASPADARVAHVAAHVAARARSAPSETVWLQDVGAVMQGSRKALKARVAANTTGARLAINLDIDNTSLATYYDRGQPVRRVRNYARLAQRLGVTVLFNTGRLSRRLGDVPAQLRRAGYVVGAICTRAPGELLPVGKQRCRDTFAEQGWTLIANIGNNDTDFTGDGYETAYRLPDYDGALG